MKKIALFIFLFSNCIQLNYAQSNEVMAKSYFLKAQQNYGEGNTATSMANLDKTVEYLGGTNAKIESLYVKIWVANNNYLNAKKHLNTYFENADESHSDYMEMLNLVADIDSKAEDQKALFKEGLEIVKVGNKYTFTTKTNKTITPIKFDGAWPFSEGLAKVMLGKKFGFINNTGQTTIPFKYDYAESFSQGLALVELEGKWGFIDKTGRTVIPFKYTDAWSFTKRGTAKVKLNDRLFYIDKTGKVVQ